MRASAEVYIDMKLMVLEYEFDILSLNTLFQSASMWLCKWAGHRKSRKTSPPYRVILHNDNFNRREYVVQVLMKVIPGMTLDNAVNIMQEAHYNGLSVVVICSQADAEEHCMQLRGNGLLSSIEPATGGC
uniref:Adaptor protein ClpS core domain-containing protein n=1 Tax=Kalanchoe fedtschenkoi TaxID=63787 RepID=A0A7N0ZSD0_KALFE